MTTRPDSENLPGLRYSGLHSEEANLIRLVNHSIPSITPLRSKDFRILSVKPARHNDQSVTKITIQSNIEGVDNKIVSMYYHRLNLAIFDNSVKTGSAAKPLKDTIFKGKRLDAKINDAECRDLCIRIGIPYDKMGGRIVEILPDFVYKIEVKPDPWYIEHYGGTYCLQGKTYFYVWDKFARRTPPVEKIVTDEEFGEVVGMVVNVPDYFEWYNRDHEKVEITDEPMVVNVPWENNRVMNSEELLAHEAELNERMTNG